MFLSVALISNALFYISCCYLNSTKERSKYFTSRGLHGGVALAKSGPYVDRTYARPNDRPEISESARPHVHGARCVLCATWRHSHGASAVRRIRRRRRARRTGSSAPYVLVNGWVGRLPSTCTRLQSYDAGAELVWLALRPHAHLPPGCHASRARFRFAAPTRDGDGSNMFTLQFNPGSDKVG
jgi:hypothetical protein